MKGQGSGIRTVTTIGSGMDVEEQSLIWEIKNFPIVASSTSRIDAQRIDFDAGAKFNQPSKWTVSLQAWKKKKRWIGIFCGPKVLPTTPSEQMCWQVRFVVKNKEGEIVSDGETDIHELTASRWGFGKLIDAKAEENRMREVMEIRIHFKLFAPSEPTSREPQPPQLPTLPTLEQFQSKFAAKACEDFASLIQNPSTGDVKMLSNDKREFSVPKGVLSARSPVFERMFRSDMKEAKVGQIELPDITGKSLEILLNFIYTGKLLPEWKQGGVLIELTNAAAKYELSDLLAFLDVMLGKVCVLENVVPLFTLANQLSLKTAEEELLKFIREKGVNCAENFLQIIKVITAMNTVEI